MMIKISPHVPSSLFGLVPVPQRPGFLGRLIHVLHKATIIEFCKFGVGSEISLAKIVSDLVAGNITASNGKSDGEDTSGPTVIVTSVSDGEGSVLYGNGVVWSSCGHVVTDTQNGKGLGAGLISFEGVTVIAGEATGPVVFVGGENGGLEGESFVKGLGDAGDGLHERRLR